MVNSLLLQSKNDIPFIEAQLIIHQPTIKEIAVIGEEKFLTVCNILFFKKEKFLSDQDKNNLRNKTNFEVLMSVINNQSLEIQKMRIDLMMFLTLLFPEYKISILEDKIYFSKEDEKKEINNKNYETFKLILEDMFCLKKLFSNCKTTEYNPSGKKASEIVKKLQERHKKLNELKGNKEEEKVSIISQYVSILAVGECKDKNQLLDYSIYQLFDEFERFNLKQDFDMTMKIKLAGAKDVKDVENWMKDIHSSSK